jgi:hypothetical protein
VTGGYDHRWNPQWKTSLWGSYGELNYSSAAGAVIGAIAGAAATDTNADWSMWTVGSRTTWTPVANLDLSLEVVYTKVNTAFDSSPGFKDEDIVSGLFRVQRNFWP